MLFTFFPYMSINNLSIRSMVCYPSHLYYMELELVQIILHFHFNSVDGVRGSLLCILHNNFYIIYICIIFYTPIETSVNKKQLQHASMPVIAEECEGSWKQPWEVWGSKRSQDNWCWKWSWSWEVWRSKRNQDNWSLKWSWWEHCKTIALLVVVFLNQRFQI